MTLALSGYLDQAWSYAARVLERVQNPRDLPALGAALVIACEVAILRGDMDALLRVNGAMGQLGQAEDMRIFQMLGAANQDYVQAIQPGNEGYAQVMQSTPGSDHVRAGLEKVRRTIAVLEASGMQPGLRQWLLHLAEVCLKARQVAEGLDATLRALDLENSEGGLDLARIFRLRGELLLRQDPPNRSAAEADFAQALEIARSQGAKTLELGAAISLARLWQIEQPAAACTLLKETLAWFTEGWETPVLQEAQGLRDQLVC